MLTEMFTEINETEIPLCANKMRMICKNCGFTYGVHAGEVTLSLYIEARGYKCDEYRDSLSWVSDEYANTEIQEGLPWGGLRGSLSVRRDI